MNTKQVYEIRQNSLFIREVKVDTPFPVKQALHVGNWFVVLLDVPPGAGVFQNVLAYSDSGELVWQIDESPYGGPYGSKMYSDVSIDNGNLIARTWDGIEYCIDSRNGHILHVLPRRI